MNERIPPKRLPRNPRTRAPPLPRSRCMDSSNWRRASSVPKLNAIWLRPFLRSCRLRIGRVTGRRGLRRRVRPREESAPSPNEFIFVDPNTDDPTDNLIDELVAQIKAAGTGGGSSPPVAVVYHQESGDHISRYITIIIPTS
jgi:hypothetical protein